MLLFLLFLIQANLDISKEKLAADLVCLLEEAARPRDVAPLKAEIESYFIVGGARIDMIGKVVEIDNNIGTNNFDIPLLENTEKGIIEAGKSKGIRIDLHQSQRMMLRRRALDILSLAKMQQLYRTEYSKLVNKSFKTFCERFGTILPESLQHFLLLLAEVLRGGYRGRVQGEMTCGFLI